MLAGFGPQRAGHVCGSKPCGALVAIRRDAIWVRAALFDGAVGTAIARNRPDPDQNAIDALPAAIGAQNVAQVVGAYGNGRAEPAHVYGRWRFDGRGHQTSPATQTPGPKRGGKAALAGSGRDGRASGETGLGRRDSTR